MYKHNNCVRNCVHSYTYMYFREIYRSYIHRNQYIFVYAFIYFGIFGEPSLDTDLGVTFSSNFFEILMIFMLIAIVAPISEELMFRGYILDSIQRLHGDKVAILLSSILFGLLHVFGGWYIVGSAFLGGLIYAWIRVKTDSLIPCIASHMMWNAFAVTVTYL